MRSNQGPHRNQLRDLNSNDIHGAIPNNTYIPIFFNTIAIIIKSINIQYCIEKIKKKKNIQKVKMLI